MKGIKLVICLVLLHVSVQGQDFEAFQQEQKLYGKREMKQIARQAELLHQPALALFFYRQLHKKKPNKEKFVVKCARLAYEVRDYPTALTFAEKWVGLDTSSTNLLLLAQLQLQLGYLPQADSSMVRLEEKFLRKDGTRNQKKKAEKLRQSVRFTLAKDSLATIDFEVENIHPLNSSFSERSPTTYGNYLYFISPATQELEQTTTSAMITSLVLKAKREANRWKVVDTLQVGNTLPEATSLGHFQRVNDTLATCALCHKTEMGKTECEIGYMILQNENVKRIALFDQPVNETGITSTHPFGFLDEEDLIIYYTSNRKDTKGGLDLYYLKYDLEKESFSGPRNLGFKVNTSEHEGYPFYNNGKLYFSSEGFAGFGGFDVLKASGEKTSFEEPSSVFSLNSSFDDLSYTHFSDSTNGILLSNRPTETQPYGSGCCDDLYHFYIANPFAFPISVIAIEKGDTTKKPLATTHFLTTQKGGLNPSFTRRDTTYHSSLLLDQDTSATVTIAASSPGYLTDVKRLPKKAPFHYSKDNPFVIELIKINKEEIVLKDIYYEFDSPNLTPKAMQTIKDVLYQILVNNPSIAIQINSHTDSKGRLSYNYQLSKKRAKSVVDYLIELGIDPERLVPKGWGETSPIAPNTFPNGEDNPTGRAKNRRTSFSIL